MLNLGTLGQLASGMGDMMSLFKKFQNDERFQKLLLLPSFQELMKDRDFLEAAKAKNLIKLMGMPKFQAFLNDSRTQEILQNSAASQQ